jgi:hypothetical protein
MVKYEKLTPNLHPKDTLKENAIQWGITLFAW